MLSNCVTKCFSSAAPVGVQHAVGAADRSAADVNRRGSNLIGCQLMHQVTDRDHIGHGIQGADFMEMNVLHRVPVDTSFRRGD